MNTLKKLIINPRAVALHRLKAILCLIFFTLMVWQDAVAQIETENSLEHHINTADGDDIKTVLAGHRQVLLNDPHLAVLAVLALRRVSEPSEVLAFVKLARQHHPNHPRLLYEEAVSHWFANDCAAAVPLFQRVLNARALNARTLPSVRTTDAAPVLRHLREDAAYFIANCTSKNGWIFGGSYQLAYDSQLWGGGVRRRITPEEDSVFDQFLDGLLGDSNIPHNVTLGYDAPSSLWAGVGGHATNIWRDGTRENRLRAWGELRHADRKGHIQGLAGAAMQTRNILGAIRYNTAIAAMTRHTERGGAVPKTQEDTLFLGQSLLVPWYGNFGITGGGRAQLTESYGRGRVQFTQYGFSLGLKHQPESILTGDQRGSQAGGFSQLVWGVEVFLGAQSDTNRYHTASIKQITVNLGRIDLGDGGRLHFEHRLAFLDYAHPRPWLRLAHRETQRDWQAVFSYPFGSDSPIHIRFSMLTRNTPDPFDAGRRFQFAIELPF